MKSIQSLQRNVYRVEQHGIVADGKQQKENYRSISRPGITWTNLIRVHELINSANSIVCALGPRVNAEDASKRTKEGGRRQKANRGEVSSHNSRLHAPVKLPFDLFASRKRRVTSVSSGGCSVITTYSLVISQRFQIVFANKQCIDACRDMCDSLIAEVLREALCLSLSLSLFLYLN